MRSLYDIGKDLADLAEVMTANEGEFPEGEAGRLLEAYFDGLTEERDEKIRRVCGLIRSLELHAENAKAEAARLKKLQAAAEAGAESVQARLLAFLEAQGIEKLKVPGFSLSVGNAGGPRSLDYPPGWDEEPASAPERYHKTKIELDKKAMREDADAYEARRAAIQAAWEKAAENLEGRQAGWDQYRAALDALAAEFPDSARLADRRRRLSIR